MLKRITPKQRQMFNILVNRPQSKGGSLRTWGRLLGVSQVAINDRLVLLGKKGYVELIDGEYKPTVEGIEQVINDRGVKDRVKVTNR